ncbi:bromodomain testis-specific protein-like [Thalassophryne amazonica]|uniref:bromodomain testis-specific protein-like n=1 Tax=Thalassophryne amazonica TaxID=390379 RepID=UPI0014724F9A|nr:bromodomain testis-specific protein-like [Thalassophryne amazonica]
MEDVVLKNAQSWTKLIRQSVELPVIKSSKDSCFQQFRKAALERGEQALKKKQIKENALKEPPEKCSQTGLSKTGENQQTSREGKDGLQTIFTEPTLDVHQDGNLQSPRCSMSQQLIGTQSSKDQGEIAHKKEEDRLRRETVPVFNFSKQWDIMTAFELSMDEDEIDWDIFKVFFDYTA